jgi:hypothetical protein
MNARGMTKGTRWKGEEADEPKEEKEDEEPAKTEVVRARESDQAHAM